MVEYDAGLQASVNINPLRLVCQHIQAKEIYR